MLIIVCVLEYVQFSGKIGFLMMVVVHSFRPTAIRNVYNWRLKETERMKAIVTELTKLGAQVEEGRDYCIITPPAQVCFQQDPQQSFRPVEAQSNAIVNVNWLLSCLCVL